MNLLNQSGAGKLYEKNGFLIPVLTGGSHDMGVQYGALMVDAMQKTWDVLIKPQLDSGILTQEEMQRWARRAYISCSTRNRQWYDGVAEGSSWPTENVCMLDQVMEYGIFQSKCHSFAGCTSILSWGKHSATGNMVIGRNMDWSETFNEFPQVLTVRKPTDGSYRFAAFGWPGMYCPFTVINEHGVYLDVHDGTSMGGSVVYVERPSILNELTDIMSEAHTLSSLITRLNGILTSTSMILSIGDEHRGASMECSSLGGNRLRSPDDHSLVVVNSFMGEHWGLGKRETVSNSLRRFANMTERLKENAGAVDADKVRELMDLRLFNDDGTFANNGGSTKPIKQDADLTTHQMVTDVAQRTLWLKVPVPDYFSDWTAIDLKQLWN
ncbi:hypothetical protein KUV95_02210 [Microbulbifer agarilyticus]|uniref:C45 family autoproteolytic acyltransferase/hydolase n=1 Tax=Microbulbifer agarilyticus TaxID=260552 RepID=UPI001C9723D4|nr:C45 family peptidase [Microbulbifer agarilyticus]MBY6210353.1 hypothetical protein [Microbulbifer agarilyticus]